MMIMYLSCGLLTLAGLAALTKWKVSNVRAASARSNEWPVVTVPRNDTSVSVGTDTVLRVDKMICDKCNYAYNHRVWARCPICVKAERSSKYVSSYSPASSSSSSDDDLTSSIASGIMVASIMDSFSYDSSSSYSSCDSSSSSYDSGSSSCDPSSW